MITLEALKDRITYNPATGEFFWNNTPAKSNYKKGDVIKGTVNFTGYQVIGIDRKIYQAHTLAIYYTTGVYPTTTVDHIDGNILNNAVSNLRLVTRSQNMMNTKLRTDNSTGVKGVHFNKNRGYYVAQITVDKKKRNIGYYKDLEEAKEAIRKARIDLHGEFARVTY